MAATSSPVVPFAPAPSADPQARDESLFVNGILAAIPRLRRYASRLARDGARAEDLVQETLLRAWEHRASFAPGTRLLAWLRTILRNVFYNGLSKGRLEVGTAEAREAEILQVEASQESRVELEQVRCALGRLPPDQREALVLMATDDLTYEQAALRLGCEPGTVKSRVSRARARLAELTGRRLA